MIALVDVSPERGRAARDNGLEHLPLHRRDPTLAGCEEIALMDTDDVGDLEFRAPHERDDSAQDGQPIERTHGTERLLSDVRVPRGGTGARVAQEDLDASQIDAGFKEMSGEAMAERMRRHRLGNPRSPGALSADPLKRP